MQKITPTKDKIAESIIDMLAIRTDIFLDSDEYNIYIVSHMNGDLLKVGESFTKKYKLNNYIKNEMVTIRKSNAPNTNSVQRVIRLNELLITDLKALKLQLC